MVVLPALSVKQGMEKVGFFNPVARAEYRSPTGSIQASPCLSPRRVVCARRVGERPVGRGTQGVFARSGEVVLVTFAETKVTQGVGRSNPQVAFERCAWRTLHYLFPGFRCASSGLQARQAAANMAFRTDCGRVTGTKKLSGYK